MRSLLFIDLVIDRYIPISQWLHSTVILPLKQNIIFNIHTKLDFHKMFNLKCLAVIKKSG